jgi:cobalamin biosynthesis protein CbiG
METLADLAPERERDPAKVKYDVAGYLKRRGMSDAEAERIVQAAFDRRATLPKRYQDVAVLYTIAETLRQAAAPKPR